MSTWHYLKAGFWQRVPIPLLGRVPLNTVAIAGFGVAGFDQPIWWAVGASWEFLWLVGTTGRVSYRRQVDATARRKRWQQVEERRLQLYNQLPPADQLRHHNLRQKCQALLAPASSPEPLAAAELFTWLHLKLLLALHLSSKGLSSTTTDPDLPRLHAGASIDLTDPAQSRLADEAVALLDPRHPLADSRQPAGPSLAGALQRIESKLADLQLGGEPVDFRPLLKAASLTAANLLFTPENQQATAEVERLLKDLE